MELTIRSHHASIPPEFGEHAEKKLARLERLLPRVDDVTIEVSYEETRSSSQRYDVQVTVRSAGTILRAEERADDATIALDLAADVLARQARRHKQRLYDRHHAPGLKAAAKEEPRTPPRERAGPPDEEDEYVMGNIVRIKHFEAPAMTHEEALVQMDLLGHDFFLFLDASTAEYSVLYKRRDGQFGILSPRRA